MGRIDYDQTLDQYQGEQSALLIELKVSSNRGETWERRKVNMADGLDGSGLSPGNIFIWQEEKYEVLDGEYGLRAEPLNKGKKPKSRKK